MTLRSPRDASYVPTLDGWRAVAVLGVIVFHLRTEIHRLWPGGVLDATNGVGRLGVDLFFAISGYLITGRLLAERDRTGGVRLGAFYVRRAFRILPPVFLLLALLGTMTVLNRWRPSPLEWFSCIFFFRNYIDGGHRVTEHLWSLSIEEHFYAVWPVLFLLVTRTRRAVWLGVLLCVGVAVWRALVIRGVAHTPFHGGAGFHTDIRLDALLWGGVLALAQRTAAGRASLRALIGPFVWCLAVVAFVVPAFVVVREEIAYTMQAVTAAVIVAGTALHPRWSVSRLLEHGALRWIGRLSYSLYLFQQPFIAEPIDVPHPYAWLLPFACFSYYLVERPMIGVGQAWLRDGWSSVSWPRRLVFVAVLFVLVPFVVRVGWPRDWTLRGAEVVVYSDEDFCGGSRTLTVGRYDLTRTPGIGNDAITSLRVGTDVRVRLCDDVHNGAPAGRCVDYAPGSVVRSVGDFNDRASFVEVTAAGR